MSAVAVATLALVVRPSAPSLAQQAAPPVEPAQEAQAAQPGRSFRGLFGPRPTETVRPRALDLNLSLYEAQDDNVLAEGSRAAADPSLQVGGRFTGLQVEIDYRRTWRRITFNANGGSGLRYYPDITGMSGATPFASVSLTGSLGRDTTFDLAQSASYTPYYQFGVFPGLDALETSTGMVASLGDRALYRQPSWRYSANGALVRRLGARSSLSVDYGLHRTDFQTISRRLSEQRGGVRFQRNITRTAGFHIGYGYRSGRYGGVAGPPRSIRAHDVDIGLDYERALGRTRRTTLGFSSGSTIVETVDATHYRVIGGAYLTRQMGESWTVRLDYSRGLELIEGFSDPFFVDGVSLAADGYITPRFDLRLMAGYSNGGLGLGFGANGFDTYLGTVRGRFALKRWLALFADYTYFRYIFQTQPVLQSGPAGGLNRNGVRIGAMLWVPFLD